MERMGRISLYSDFLFFGGADVAHKRIHDRAPRRRKTKKPKGLGRDHYKQANPTGFEPALPIA
jgi:hypothetical protein